MRGVNASGAGNIAGALKFEVRAQVIAQGGQTTANTNSIDVTNADSATILVAIATSYRGFEDVTGDPGCHRQGANYSCGQDRHRCRCSLGTSRNISGSSGGFPWMWADRCHEVADRRADSQFRQGQVIPSSPSSTFNSDATS